MFLFVPFVIQIDKTGVKVSLGKPGSVKVVQKVQLGQGPAGDGFFQAVSGRRLHRMLQTPCPN